MSFTRKFTSRQLRERFERICTVRERTVLPCGCHVRIRACECSGYCICEVDPDFCDCFEGLSEFQKDAYLLAVERFLHEADPENYGESPCPPDPHRVLDCKCRLAIMQRRDDLGLGIFHTDDLRPSDLSTDTDAADLPSDAEIRQFPLYYRTSRKIPFRAKPNAAQRAEIAEAEQKAMNALRREQRAFLRREKACLAALKSMLTMGDDDGIRRYRKKLAKMAEYSGRRYSLIEEWEESRRLERKVAATTLHSDDDPSA